MLAATMFWIPMRTYHLIWRHSSGTNDTPSSLSDVALVLLLVLVHFPAGHCQQVNGVKEALKRLRDRSLSPDGVGTEEGQGSGGSSAESSYPCVSFAYLYEYCAAGGCRRMGAQVDVRA